MPNQNNSENIENSNPLATLHKQLLIESLALDKELEEAKAEREKMRTKVQELLAKRRLLLLQKKRDEEEKKTWTK